MTQFESQNAYTREHFPDDWDSDDFAFLAEFVDEEFGAELVSVLNERDYDYELFREVSDE